MESQSNITVITATLDEISRMIDQKTDERVKVLESIEKRHGELLGCTIDRAFLERNLGLSRRKIEKYEREGVLHRLDNPNDFKGCYYSLKDFLKIKELA